MRKVVVQVENFLRPVWEYVEDAWFDRRRRVHTAGNMALAVAGISAEEQRDSELYQPARARHVRKALRALPVKEVSAYTYVDLGSGKGRTLFVAAEWPFRRVIGVEFSRVMHERACENIRSFQSGRRRCGEIVSEHGNAMEFVFPAGPLVVYAFNPFGAATMQRVLDNLETSLREEPRHVVAVLLWPQCADQVARVSGMRLVRTAREFQIFEAHAPGAR